MKFKKITSSICLLASFSGMAQELVTFKAGDVATAEAFNQNFQLTHSATVENAKQVESVLEKVNVIEQKANGVEQEINRVSEKIAAMSNRTLHLYMDGYGLLGEVLSFGGGINTRAVVKKDDLIFNINGDYISVASVQYTDDKCTKPVVHLRSSLLRGLGTVLAGYDKDGALYTLSEHSTKVEGQNVYEYANYSNGPLEPSQLTCQQTYHGENYTGFTVNKIDTPDFISVSNVDNFMPPTIQLTNSAYLKYVE
ncbi:hypothetical protein HG263_04655 [Pseudoalteromonas sp. JBTF-M23]|uniref:Uncharacterized protein n=1 Tax=Pseudoalteromonas caenipelagi TaxID=2726988 RepID=A0A849VD14_9GAMM|nr:hypothetical protein [Pseudoalteromonas caenipelagi]NOU49824.1 hypothetical protein [Pseudoalteromonas caenipelagi]